MARDKQHSAMYQFAIDTQESLEVTALETCNGAFPLPAWYAEAMHSLAQRFPDSLERRLSTEMSGGVSGSGISGGLSGGVSGGISGGVSGGVLIAVAGTMEVEMDVQGILTQEVVEDMFKKGIADALEMTIEHVVKLTASQIGQGPGLRRLQPLQTKRYEVSYEVIPPRSMDPDDVLEKANRIAMPGTVESQVFQQVLVATDGVAQVRRIVSKIPAHKIVHESTTSAPHTQADEDEDKISWKGVVIGGVTIAMGIACLAVSAVMIKRRMSTVDQSANRADYL